MLLIWGRGDVGLVHVVPADSPGRLLLQRQGLGRELFWTRGMPVPASSVSQSLSHLVTCDSGLGLCSPRSQGVTAGFAWTLSRGQCSWQTPGTGADGGSLSFNLWLWNVSRSALVLVVFKAALLRGLVRIALHLVRCMLFVASTSFFSTCILAFHFFVMTYLVRQAVAKTSLQLILTNKQTSYYFS